MANKPFKHNKKICNKHKETFLKSAYSVCNSVGGGNRYLCSALQEVANSFDSGQ